MLRVDAMEGISYHRVELQYGPVIESGHELTARHSRPFAIASLFSAAQVSLKPKNDHGGA